MTPDRENIERMLVDLSDNMQHLSPWEQQFVESANDQWDRIRHLTEPQIDKLVEIHGRWSKI